MNEFISIDGSHGSGGGQILRVALALSALTLKPVEVSNVRAKRTNPGLRPQHLAAAESVSKLASARATGLHVGSRRVSFNPTRILSGSMRFDIGTAGSTTLVLQALIPPMCFASGTVETNLIGGTNNPLAPPVEFLQWVLQPALAKMGCRLEVDLLRRGFYPVGKGELRARCYPMVKLKPIQITEFGRLEEITGLVYSSRLPSHIPRRIAASVKEHLAKSRLPDAAIEIEEMQPGDPRCSQSPGCGISLVAHLTSGAVLSGDSLGRPGKTSEAVGREAAQRLLEQLRTQKPVDSHLGDQLVVYMAAAEGTSRIGVTELTAHTLTSIHVAEQITGARFSVEGEERTPGLISCQGVGLKNRSLQTPPRGIGDRESQKRNTS